MAIGVIILIIILLFLLWPRIMAWLGPLFQRWAMRRVEKMVRNAAGMPPRDDRRRKQSGKRRGGNEGKKTSRRQRPSEPIIPKEYAEDVEFTETVDYESDRVVAPDGEHVSEHIKIKVEQQVSDAEWVEIKK